MTVLLTSLTVISSCGGGSSNGTTNGTSSVDSPSNLVISDEQDAGLTLSWDSVTNADSYRVYYQLGETLNIAEAISTEATQTSLSLSSLTNYSTYTFAVSASNSSANSALSASIQGIAGIRLTSTQAQDFKATIGDAQVQLEWQALTGASSYEISYSSLDESTQTIKTEATTQLIENLTNSTTYTFSIIAINPLDRSGAVQTQARRPPSLQPLLKHQRVWRRVITHRLAFNSPGKRLLGPAAIPFIIS